MRKLLPLLLALLLVLTLPVSAAAGKLTATAVKDGKTVTVTVQLHNPGIIATRIFVRYDSKVLKLDRAENGEIFEKGKALFGKDTTDNPYVMLWDDGMRRDNITKSGTLCTVTFTITGGTASGKTNVRIALDQASTFDVNLNEVTVEDCSVLIDVPVVSSSSAAETTKASGTTAERTTLPASPSTTKAGTSNAQTNKTTASTPKTTKAPVTASVGTTAASTASAQTHISAQSTNAAQTAQEGSAVTNAATVPGAPDATAANATVPDAQPETVPDLLTATGSGETAAPTAESVTPTQTDEAAETNASGAKYLLLLLVIPVAAVVIILVRKKEK